MSKPRKFVRVTYSLPPQIAEDISYVARRMGVSQSSFVAEMFEKPVGDMREMMLLVPENTATMSAVEAKRLRGTSINIVADRVADAVRALGDRDD